MDLKQLQKFEKKEVTICLTNGFKFTHIFPKISEEGLIEFFDVKEREEVSISPEFISIVSYKKDRGEKMTNEKSKNNNEGNHGQKPRPETGIVEQAQKSDQLNKQNKK
jgi:hypothetical protein